MLNATWTGTISFGLVSIPVKLFAATEDHGVELHRSHETCMVGEYGDAAHRVSQRMVCKDCEEVVPYSDLGSVFEDSDGTTVPLTKAELDGLPNTKTKTIDLCEFVDPDEINPLRLGKPYYVRPNLGTFKSPKANPSYELFVRTLQQTGKAAIGSLVMRSRENLVAITVHDGMLVARVVLWADELRVPEFSEPTVPATSVTEAEVAMAVNLVDAMTVKWDVTAHVDRRDVALRDLITSKQAPVVASRPDAQIIDLFARVNASVAG
jgi:DNA end-binding protein Ku